MAEDLEVVRAYEEWAQADEEATAVRMAALEAAADRWRDLKIAGDAHAPDRSPRESA